MVNEMFAGHVCVWGDDHVVNLHWTRPLNSFELKHLSKNVWIFWSTCVLLSSKAQIAISRKELSKKEMPKHEADILSVFVIPVEQQLQQQEEKVQHQQLKKEQQQLQDREQQQPKKKEKELKEKEDEEVEQEQYKEHKQTRFDGEAYFIQHQEQKE